jgi:hypothetical protein
MLHIRALQGYLKSLNKTNKRRYAKCVYHILVLVITEIFRPRDREGDRHMSLTNNSDKTHFACLRLLVLLNDLKKALILPYKLGHGRFFPFFIHRH